MNKSAVTTKQNGLLSLFHSVFILMVLQLVSLVVLLPSEYSAKAVSEEYASLTQTYGKSAGKYVSSQANKAYSLVMKDTGLEEKVNSLFAPIRARNKLSEKLGKFSEGFLPILRDRSKSLLFTVFKAFPSDDLALAFGPICDASDDRRDLCLEKTEDGL